MILQIPLGETFSGVFLIITKKCKNLKHIKQNVKKCFTVSRCRHEGGKLKKTFC